MNRRLGHQCRYMLNDSPCVVEDAWKRGVLLMWGSDPNPVGVVEDQKTGHVHVVPAEYVSFNLCQIQSPGLEHVDT